MSHWMRRKDLGLLGVYLGLLTTTLLAFTDLIPRDLLLACLCGALAAIFVVGCVQFVERDENCFGCGSAVLFVVLTLGVVLIAWIGLMIES